MSSDLAPFVGIPARRMAYPLDMDRGGGVELPCAINRGLLGRLDSTGALGAGFKHRICAIVIPVLRTGCCSNSPREGEKCIELVPLHIVVRCYFSRVFSIFWSSRYRAFCECCLKISARISDPRRKVKGRLPIAPVFVCEGGKFQGAIVAQDNPIGAYRGLAKCCTKHIGMF